MRNYVNRGNIKATKWNRVPVTESLAVFTKLYLSPEVQQSHALLYCTEIIVQQKPTEQIINQVCNQVYHLIDASTMVLGQSQWPRGLTRRTAAARLLRFVGSNSTRDMDVCLLCCVLSGRGLCDELITRPEESYRLWCVIVCCNQVYHLIDTSPMVLGRDQWPRGLTRRSAAARLLRLWVRILPGTWMSVCCVM